MDTLELILTRVRYADDRLLGSMRVQDADVWSCWTLEDKYREIIGVPVAQWKIHGETAIPMGRYRITLAQSKRFGPDTLTVNDVDGFQYIRIHGGNTPLNTEGCILVGTDVDGNWNIKGGTSQPALKALKEIAVPFIKAGGEVWLTIK